MTITLPAASDWLAEDSYATLPAEWYTDPAIFHAEQQQILAKTWIYACHVDEVSEPGQVHSVDAGDGFPVIVSRDGDGELHAFFNVCRHRGHLLVSESGPRSSIQCPYHAWTYGLDGCLRGVPRGGEDPGLDRGRLGLKQLRLALWGPLVFVCADESAPPLESYAAPIQEALDAAGIDLDRYRFKARTRHVVDATGRCSSRTASSATTARSPIRVSRAGSRRGRRWSRSRSSAAVRTAATSARSRTAPASSTSTCSGRSSCSAGCGRSWA